MEKSIKRVAVYLRTTKEEMLDLDLDGIYEISAQEKACVEFCNQWPDKEIVTFRDISSGTLSVEERPGLKSLLERACSGEFDAVVVFRIDRLSRNIKMLLDIVEELGSSTDLYSATEPLNTRETMGRAILNMLATFATLEKGVTNHRHCTCEHCC